MIDLLDPLSALTPSVASKQLVQASRDGKSSRCPVIAEHCTSMQSGEQLEACIEGSRGPDCRLNILFSMEETVPESQMPTVSKSRRIILPLKFNATEIPRSSKNGVRS